MCTVGGPVDIDFDEGLKAKDCKCKDCGGRFSTVGKNLRCPTCGSDNCIEVA